MKTVENEAVKVSKDDFAFDPNELYDLKEETWLSSVVAAKLKNMHDKALLLRTSVLIDLEKIKTRVCPFYKICFSTIIQNVIV